MTRRSTSRGVTLVELLGVLAVAAIVLGGLTTMVGTVLDDMRGEQAGAYQSQVTDAAERYIRDNYAAIVADAGASRPSLIDIDALKHTHQLSDAVASINAYGQTPCVLVLQPQVGKLQALVLTRGGEPIPEKRRAFVAAHAGKGGGFIAADSPTVARGAFGSWELPLAGYASATCTPAPQHLASAMFFDGPSTSAVDFVYRNKVPGHPELNDMSVPLGMRFQGVAGASDDYCGPAVAASTGRIASDDGGHVLSCSDGRWQRQGSAFWKDPVATAALLPAASASVMGDVVMTLDDMRTYKWDGAAWTPLAVDRDGNLGVPNTLSADTLQVRKIAVAGDPCEPDGLVARDADGAMLSCQIGVWKVQGAMQIEALDRELSMILPSAFVSYAADTPIYTGPIHYDPNDDWYQVIRTRTITLKKAATVTFNGWAIMNRSLVDDPTVRGKVWLHVLIYDKDTGSTTAISNSKSMSTTLRDESTTINATLAQPLPKNKNGYDVVIDLRWTTFNGAGGVGQGIYNRANWRGADGTVTEETPLLAGWTLDAAY